METLKKLWELSLGTKLKLFTLVLIAISILLGTGWLSYRIILFQLDASLETQEIDVEALTKKEEPPQAHALFAFSYELENIGIQLMDKKGIESAYAQFTLVLDCPSEASKQVLEISRAKLLDAVFDVANNLYLEDVRAGTGIATFKEKLIATFRDHFHEDAPRQIALKRWIVN